MITIIFLVQVCAASVALKPWIVEFKFVNSYLSRLHTCQLCLCSDKFTLNKTALVMDNIFILAIIQSSVRNKIDQNQDFHTI